MDELSELSDLDKAQILLQMFMIRFNCEEDKARELLVASQVLPNEILGSLYMVTAPTLVDIKRMYKI